MFPLTLYKERILAIYYILIQNNISSVLDCGCGEGRLLNFLVESNKFKKLAGIDNCLKRIEKARKKAVNKAVVYQHQSFFDLDKCVYLDEYEAIVASEVIEHFLMGELDEFFRITLNVLHPKILIITTPNRSYNKNYENLYNGLRHSSHEFELSEQEASDFANSIIKKYSDYSVTCDFCDSNHSSHLITFKRG